MATNNKPGPMADVVLTRTNEELDAADAKAKAEKAAAGYPKVSAGADEWDKKNIQSRYDAADEKIDPWLAADPMREIVERYGRPGMAPKFLSPRVVDTLGMRGYELVKDVHGDPVKMGTLMLGQIPEKLAEARREAAVTKSKKEVSSIQDTYGTQVRKVAAEARDMGLRVLEPGEMDGEYFNPDGSGRRLSIG